MSRCCLPIPGRPGESGAAGAAGSAGAPAWGSLAEAFTMPGLNGTADAELDDARFIAIGMPVFVEGLGVLQVLNKTGNTVTLFNLADGGAGYAQNSPPGTIAPPESRVVPTGWQGLAGNSLGGAPVDATYLTQTPNATLTNEQSLDGLATGVLKSTNGTGVVTTIPLGILANNLAPVDGAAALTAGDVVFATANGLRTFTLAQFLAWVGSFNFNLIQATAPTLPPPDPAQVWQCKAADTGSVYWWNPATAAWMP